MKEVFKKVGDFILGPDTNEENRIIIAHLSNVNKGLEERNILLSAELYSVNKMLDKKRKIHNGVCKAYRARKAANKPSRAYYQKKV